MGPAIDDDDYIIMRPSLQESALRIASRPSVRHSVLCLHFGTHEETHRHARGVQRDAVLYPGTRRKF